MTSPVPASLGLSPAEVTTVLEAAAMAPSVHNSQPWRFRVLPDRIELHADLTRRLPATDPGDKELRLACGAALTNLRIALEALGIRPMVTLLPHGQARDRLPGKDFEREPLIAVVCSYYEGLLAELHAGQAMQRVLLTATTLGLSASFIAQPIEVPECRKQLRHLLGAGITPQTILRIGHGSPVAPTPRRPIADLLMDGEPALPGGTS
ncbi:nitroreductase family protein [Kutzneria kofuensis]|uniref:Nitroreductase n=1 Tax=Kutzneria kofuensis TaxID=103725 RepID=A0A7W9KST8_9PSEU|nr:nitroreductase family protein [Kutzneria kofuensis]MBB5898081.1 nitroreductase [Kutzneria kofuensis]